jgi:hypothetical protein
MEPEIKHACVKAGLKLGGGLLLVMVTVGLRIVSADPDGVKADVEQLEWLDAELEAEAADSPIDRDRARDPAPTPAPREEKSMVSRLSGGVSDRFSGSTPGRSPDAEQLVSCRLEGGTTHFMRRADCAARGGGSTEFRSSR